MRQIAFVGLLFLLVGCTATQTLPNDPRLLIERLVKTNGAETYRDAVSAYESLKSMGTRVFPLLVKSADDPRPACGCFQQETTTATTVGDVCFEIIQRQVEVDLPKELRHLHFLSKPTLSQWWESRADRTLRELQIEAARHSLAAAEKANFASDAEKKGVLQLWQDRLKELRARP